ncbi:MAG: cytochrome c3 family protein [Flavobacteriaceae bacterium]|jgi:mono/diheme cytochrome c family protein|nr:cytochrome c3 family protein [Flavobacteriaceae bacterium]
MKKVGLSRSISGIIQLSLALWLMASSNIFAQDVEAGKALFNSQCAACHNLDRKMTGPPLRGMADKYEVEWLHKWIRNSSEMIKSGDERANKIFNEYNQLPMTAFPQLSDEDLGNIIAYTMTEKAVVEAAPGGDDGGSASGGGVSNEVILGALALVLAMLVIMLLLVRNVLTKIAKANNIDVVHKEKSLPIWKAFAKNQFLVLVTVIFLMLASAYYVYGWFMQIGVDKGYEPIQPIHYSHRIHAGDNGIDCKYCHSAAREGKHSNIPSLNVCMNCHKNVSEVAESTATAEYSKAFYDAEIQKLYDAVGWDKDEQKYTGNTKPVKWVRIHNLPDLVYFNHAQHVTVAGIECQTCHGPVEEMEIMSQHAPLTMGWCIDCHRQTEVKLKDNEYYKKIHEELSKKYGVEKLTAAQMGGLECGKCHY